MNSLLWDLFLTFCIGYTVANALVWTTHSLLEGTQ